MLIWEILEFIEFFLLDAVLTKYFLSEKKPVWWQLKMSS